jgi:hypothetical protein
MSCVEFPRRAGIPGLDWAAPNIPAGMVLLTDPSFKDMQEEDLTLDVRRYLPPTLLEALHGLKRCPQKFGHLFLGLAQRLAQRMKFFPIHKSHSFTGIVSPMGRKIALTIYTTKW